MKTKQIVFTKPYTAELLEVEYDVYLRLANEKNFPIGVLFDWNKI